MGGILSTTRNNDSHNFNDLRSVLSSQIANFMQKYAIIFVGGAYILLFFTCIGIVLTSNLLNYWYNYLMTGCALLCCAFSIYSFYYTIKIGPGNGSVPTEESKKWGDEEKEMAIQRALRARYNNLKHLNIGQNVRYCSRCEKFQQPRAFHCKQCNRCISRRDHHCIWMCSCIGKENFKYFYLFLLYVTISLLFVSYFCSYGIMYSSLKLITGIVLNKPFIHSNYLFLAIWILVMVSVLVIALILFITLLRLWLLYTSIVINNETNSEAIERSIYENTTEMCYEPMNHDKGIQTNIREFLGHGITILLPFPTMIRKEFQSRTTIDMTYSY
ncbi:Palmitoyltransferase [Entamoeba marina]